MASLPAGPYEPISLGYACEVKYQLSRNLYRRKFPDGDLEELRRQLLTPELGQKSFQRHVFDWQITPFEAVLACLEADFQGVFEREDLVAEGGEVAHRRLGIRYPHEFHPVDGVLDGAVIDAQYAAARGKFDHLSERFRRHLKAPGRFLYVFRQLRIYDESVRLLALLNAGQPGRDVKVLYVGEPGEDQWLAPLEGQVFTAWAPLSADKPAGRRWEGDDAPWDAVLDPIDLVPHDASWIGRTLDDSIARAEPASTHAASPRTGLRGLLQKLGL